MHNHTNTGVTKFRFQKLLSANRNKGATFVNAFKMPEWMGRFPFKSAVLHTTLSPLSRTTYNKIQVNSVMRPPDQIPVLSPEGLKP
jgi:hypothetical protein